MRVRPRFAEIEHVRRADGLSRETTARSHDRGHGADSRLLQPEPNPKKGLPRHPRFGSERQRRDAEGIHEHLKPRCWHRETQPTGVGVKVSTALYFSPQARRAGMASKTTEAPEHPEVAEDIIEAQRAHRLSDLKLAKAAGISPRHLREVKKGS